MSGPRGDRILVAAPMGRDAELICRQLSTAGMRAEGMPNVVALANDVARGAGAILVTEEALTADSVSALERVLGRQPAWSDIPVILLAGEASAAARSRALEGLDRRTTVILIDRPVRIQALVSAAQSALRSRRRQYEIRDLMEQLERRLHERDKFLAILGHELRNPLSAILLAAQITDSEGKLDSEHARLIERQSRHLTQIVNDLLDLSRVVAGKIMLKPQRTDLRVIARQSIATVDAAREAAEVEIRPHLPDAPVWVDADPVRLDQVLSNLLSNAVKYTPAGGHVDVWLEHDGGNALVRVGDDGVGIAPDRLEGIFEMFAQLDNAIGRAQGGMGIGLALVRNLVLLHGGSVRAESAGVGKGSEFVVTLPLASSPVAAREREHSPEITADAPHEARRIVIVEDNRDVRELLALRLKRLGHEVVGAEDGVEGLNRISELRPDLALVDLGLPGMDGFEVAARTRQELGDAVLLVAVSGFGQPEDKRRAFEAGFDEHLTKPAELTLVSRLVAASYHPGA